MSTWLPWQERPAGHPRSAIPDCTAFLVQIRLFGVAHGVGNEAGRENRLAVFTRAWSRWADTLSAKCPLNYRGFWHFLIPSLQMRHKIVQHFPWGLGITPP